MDKQNFRFVSPAEMLNPEIEKQITEAKAWASITLTGQNKPTFGELGGIVSVSYSELHNKLDIISNQLSDITEKLKQEKHHREEADLIIANHVAKIENILKEKDIIQSQKERIEDAHSVLYYCVICMENQRQIRFSPCTHTVCCSDCANTIINGTVNSRKCPICRATLTGIHQVLLS